MIPGRYEESFEVAAPGIEEFMTPEIPEVERQEEEVEQEELVPA